MNDVSNPIPLVTRDDPAARSGDVVAENVAALKALFPSIVTDGNVDLDVLRQLLGDALDEGEERYGLNWKGKKRARAFALTPSLGTLRPVKDDSVDWDTTKNIVIEGDNLEVLKLLRKSYAGRVQLIYIDPPYNTGNDFVYPDDYRDSIGNYERLTGQRDLDGALLVSESERGGRLHTSWLNMMLPRLYAAKDLLEDHGIIFVSIADEEVASLILIMSEVFGEERRAAIIHRRKNRKPHNAGGTVSFSYEFIVAFYSRALFKLVQEYAIALVDEKGTYAIYPVIQGDKKVRTYTFPKGIVVEAAGWRKGNIAADRNQNLDIEVLDEPEVVNGVLQNDVRISGRFRLTDESGALSRAFTAGNIFINSKGFPKEKRYRTDEDSKIDNHHWDIDGGKNEDGDNEIKSLFDLRSDNNIFKYPKPTKLIQKILVSAGDSDSLVMDFFAGSGTTGDAVMRQNAEDNGSRRFILVQLPEVLDPEKKEQAAAAELCQKLGKPKNIAELTKERLRRARKHLRNRDSGSKLDSGFRVYKLANSNLKPWQPDPDNLEASLLDAVDNVLPDRTEDDMLVELLLKTGIDLTLPGETRTIVGKAVHALGGGVLMVFLGDIAEGDAEELGQGICDWRDELDPPRPTTFYFKDSGFEGAATKANLAAIIRQRLGKAGVEKLASI